MFDLSLARPSELRTYQNILAEKISVRFPIEYLERSHVRLLRLHGEILGGYTIVLKGPFRVVESLPDEIQAQLTTKKLCEATGMWLSPKVSNPLIVSRFWLQFCLDLLFSGKSECIYSYSLRSSRLTKVYSYSEPKILFRGLTKVLPGMPHPEEESVELTSVWKTGLLPFRNPKWIFKKLITKRNPCYQN